MDGGPADEAIVAVKSVAEDGTGDSPEGKTIGKRQEVGGEGWNAVAKQQHKVAVIRRS